MFEGKRGNRKREIVKKVKCGKGKNGIKGSWEEGKLGKRETTKKEIGEREICK